ncbi:hypothetical protein BH10BAC2_BH10BAC2_10170 [soil metagenome]
MKRYCIILVFFYSCSQNNSNIQTEHQNSDYNNTSDTFWRGIKNNYQEFLGLKSIENSRDSFEIRIWIDEQLLIAKHLFIIKKDNRGTEKIHYAFSDQKNFALYAKDTVTDKSTIVKETPLSIMSNFNFLTGDDSFFDLLKDIKLENFPFSCDGGGEDGISYYVEIRRNDFYKLLTYINPSDDKSNKYCMQFSEFINNFLLLLPKDEFLETPYSLQNKE